MKHRFLTVLLALSMVGSLTVGASAQQYTTPVTLTVVNTQRPISVTVPASLPVSVVDGYVVTASNAVIQNNAEFGAAKVTEISVLEGAFTIGCFENFAAKRDSIALSINGCGTILEGALHITDEAFPEIEAGKALPLCYQAKVAVSGDVKSVTAATVVFTISAVEGGGE